MAMQVSGQTAVVSEQHAQQRIRPWWAKADIHPAYPATGATAAALMAMLEYDCTEATLDEFCRKGYLADVREWGGQRRWTAANIIELAAALEHRRRWRIDSKVHAPKWNRFELAQREAEAAGDESCFPDLAAHTAEDLLLIVEKADDRSVRQAAVVALRVKLRDFLKGE